MSGGLTVDSLPPLEVSVTGIDRPESRVGRPSDGMASTTRSASSERPVSSSAASHKKRAILSRYWHALHHAVAPELSLQASEDHSTSSSPVTPLATARLPDSENTDPFAARSATLTSNLGQEPIRPPSAASPQDPPTQLEPPASATEPSTPTDSPQKAEFLAVDRDFDELLAAPPAFDDQPPDPSPRNSTFNPLSLSHSDSASNRGSEARPPLNNDRLSSGNISATTSYPPPSSGVHHVSSDPPTSKKKESDRKSCLLRTINFLAPSFKEPGMEKAFRKETWQVLKPAAIVSSTIVFLLWVAYAGDKPILSPLYKTLYYGIDASFNVLIILSIIFDLYLKFPWVYQFIAFVNCWSLPNTILASSYQCRFFWKLNHSSSICPPDRDFLSILLWPLAYPVIHLFLLSAWRGPVTIGYTIWLTVAIWSIVQPHNDSFGVNLINVTLFQLAILWVSLLKERSDRHLFLLHERVRQQFRHTKQAQRRERTAETSKQAFVSYIFHEVRIPLNAALLACQNLEAENLLGHIPEQTVMARGLNSSLLTMQRVLNDILDYQKMESMRLTWVPAPFSLHQTFTTVIESYQPYAESRNVKIISELDPRIDRLTRVLMGDPQRVAQAVSNLLSNACKWARSKVHCRTQLLFPLATASLDVPVRAALIRVEVEDDGVGLSPDDLEDQKLFSPYVQTDTQLQTGGKGAGLGLALTKENVKLAGGRLGVDSQADHGAFGATFWFEMVFGMPNGKLEPTTLNVTPIVPPTYIFGTPPLSAVNSSRILPNRLPLRILLADDDPLTCKLMQRMLARKGHTAVIAPSGAEAIKILKENQTTPFDLALLDGNIGDMTGWDLLKKLKAEGFKGYACGLSGSGDAKEPFDAAGAKDTLLKPLNGEALDRLLAEVARFRGHVQ